MIPEPGESPEDLARDCRDRSVLYLRNAQEFLGRQEFTKVSEFIWGAMAQAVKAVAAANGYQLHRHRQLWDYTRELARELEAPTIYQGFRQANSLHSNFYEAELPIEEVIDSLETVRESVSKLLTLLPPEDNLP